MLHADIDASWSQFTKALERHLARLSKSSDRPEGVGKPSKASFVRERNVSLLDGCRAAHKVASIMVIEAEPGSSRASMSTPQPGPQSRPPSDSKTQRPNSQWLRVIDPDRNASSDTLTGRNGQRSISFSHGVANEPLSTPRQNHAYTIPPRIQMPRPLPESYDFSHLDRDPPAPLLNQMPMPEPLRSGTLFCDSPQPMSTFSPPSTYSRGNTFLTYEGTQDSGLDGILREFDLYNQQHASGLPTIDDSSTATNSPDGTLGDSSFINYVLGPAAGEREPTFPSPFLPSDQGLVRV